MHPDLHQGRTCGGPGNGHFIFMMGKHKLPGTGMNIKAFPQIGHGDGRTLKVQRGPDIAPAGINANTFLQLGQPNAFQ